MKFKRGATAWLISSLSRLKLIYFYSNSLPPPSPFNQSPDKTLPIDGHLHDTDTHLTSAPSMFMFKENWLFVIVFMFESNTTLMNPFFLVIAL